MISRSASSTSVPARVAAGCVVAALIAGACGSDDDGGSTGPISDGFAQIPLEVYERAEDADTAFIEIAVADLAAVSATEGLDEPEAGRSEQAIQDWYVDLALGRDDAESDVTVVLPPDPNLAMASPADVEDATGLDTGAIESFAHLVALPTSLSVYSGGLLLSSDLESIGDGLVSLGGGEDGELSLDTDPTIDRLGRPVRFAERDGTVALSYSTDLVAAWNEGGQTLVDDARFRDLAGVLDDAGMAAAFVLAGDFGEISPFASDELAAELDDAKVIETPFGIAAGAMGVVGDEPVNVIAYVFDGDDDAEAAVEDLESAWSDAQLITRPGAGIDDYYDLRDVDRTGRVVAVTVAPQEGIDTRRIIDLMLSQDLQFMHR